MENTLATRWMELLAQEGYRALLDVNQENEALSRIAFKREGKTYELHLDENDPTFAHLELAFTVDAQRHERDLLVRVGNENNQCLKAAKTTIDARGDGARFHMEWFQEGMPTPGVLDRILAQLATAAREFFEKVGAAEAEAAGPVEGVTPELVMPKAMA